MGDGLDAAGVFCTDRLRLADAPQRATIPAGLAPGDYLLRAELLTLNDAAPRADGGNEQPQFYPGCVAVTVAGTAGTARPDTVSIPGYVSKNTPGLVYNIWTSPVPGVYSNYPVIGPPVFVDGTSPAPGKASSKAPAAPASPTTKGKAPANTPVDRPRKGGEDEAEKSDGDGDGDGPVAPTTSRAATATTKRRRPAETSPAATATTRRKRPADEREKGGSDGPEVEAQPVLAPSERKKYKAKGVGAANTAYTTVTYTKTNEVTVTTTTKILNPSHNRRRHHHY